MKRKKGEKNIFATLVKLLISIIVFALQILIFYMMYMGSVEFTKSFSLASTVLQFAVVLYVLYSRERMAYQIPWLVFIMFFPVAGIIIYLIWGQRNVGRKLKKARDKCIDNSHYLLVDDSELVNKIEENDLLISRQVKLIKKLSNY